MKNISIFFAALVAVLFSVAETSAQITPPYYNPANVRITGGTIDGTSVGSTTAAAGAFTTLAAGNTAITGTLSATGDVTFTGATTGILNVNATGTNATRLSLLSDGGQYFFGANDSAGAGFGGTAYAQVIYAPAGRVVETSIAGTGVITKVSSTGLAVTGTLSATGQGSLGGALFWGGLGSGVYVNGNSGANTWEVVTNSAQRIQVSDTGLSVTGTLSATEPLTITKATGVPKVSLIATTGTNEVYYQVVNTGGAYYFGVENSVGSWFGATAYAATISAPAGKVIQDVIGGAPIVTTSSTGLAVTGTLSATGVASFTDATDSSSTTTGSLKTAGGLGVAKNTYIGGFLDVSSSANTGEIRLGGSNVLSAINSPTTLTINSASFSILYLKGNVTFDKTITAAGTTGAQTINKTTGRVNFAAAATSLVVTNSLATANSICHVTKATNDATMRLGACVAAAGSITIYADVAPAAETAVNFTVTN